jgi:hypothetical protein
VLPIDVDLFLGGGRCLQRAHRTTLYHKINN